MEQNEQQIALELQIVWFYFFSSLSSIYLCDGTSSVEFAYSINETALEIDRK